MTMMMMIMLMMPPPRRAHVWTLQLLHSTCAGRAHRLDPQVAVRSHLLLLNGGSSWLFTLPLTGATCTPLTSAAVTLAA